MRYYTDNNIEVTKRIKSEKTFLFRGTSKKDKENAEKKAKSIRSYVYEVFSYNENNERILIGYAVPR
ncbi:hypothetical protein R5N98_02845 [Tenacibaculum maritimum]|uniref:hypothetical protein n=1 Tax=Tenacibaculum maritimum TaxID=107401 RepID=UPI0012E67770|nr:hypothetical protein [Tenacibaculum maritimum]CAA0253501.1 conserved hypothetical protein [Tenacibaculum maritimum]